jgi:hypothetical protein
VDFDSRLAEGTCITARKFSSRMDRFPEFAVFGRPYPGEVISGDDAVFVRTASGFIAAVCDGLGHGPEAREASHEAISAIADKQEDDIAEIVIRINARMARTRGCAISLLRFTGETREIEAVSAGDVHAHVYGRSGLYAFAAMPLVLRGAELQRRKIRIDRFVAEPYSVVAMFSDGLMSKTSLKNRADLLRQSAVTMAQYLIETEARPNDDALVLIAKLPG